MKRWLLLALLAPAAQACELPGGAAQSIQSANVVIAYRTAPLRVGEHFAVEFAVCPAPQAVTLDAWMPDHRHGMNYKPAIAALGGGRYRAEGLMFHMPGRWEFVFEVRAGGRTERLAHSVRVE
jgi:YtkA-like